MGDPGLVNAKETFASQKVRMDAKGSRARVAFALLSALAICCAVMYITADGDAETDTVLKSIKNKYIGAGFDLRHPKSIESVDVKKAGMIVTNTPDGRMRLLKYLSKVEKQCYLECKQSFSCRGDCCSCQAHPLCPCHAPWQAGWLPPRSCNRPHQGHCKDAHQDQQVPKSTECYCGWSACCPPWCCCYS